MPKCIIHIGMHNTDTNTIQHSLHGLDDGKFYYARLSKAPNHSLPLFTMFSGAPQDHPLNRKRQIEGEAMKAQVAQARGALQESIAAAGERTLLISGEGIVRLETAGLERLKAFFARNNCSVEIAAYVRAPRAFITSAFLGFIKSGHMHNASLGKLYPNYHSRFAKFDEVFGRESVHLWPFAPGKFDSGSTVRDFCAKLGIDQDPIIEIRSDNVPSREQAALIYQYGQWCAGRGFAPPTGRAAAQVLEIVRDAGSTPFRFSGAMLDPVLRENSADIAWMEGRLGQPFDEPKSPARAGEIASEKDLLEPVPGADAILERALAEAEIAGGFTGEDASCKMIRALLGTPAREERKTPKAGTGESPRPATGKPRKPNQAQIQQAMPRLWNNPISDGPRPLLNRDKKLTVLWSPKSACTTAYVWFSHVSGFSKDVREYAAWPHRHRVEQYQMSKLYADSLADDLSVNRVLRIIRDPYGRAVSIFRHALQTDFADKELGRYKGGRYDAITGYSFQDFLDFVATLNMPKVDIHFRPQFHPYEAIRGPDRVINISKQDLFAELNDFEARTGLPPTEFADLNWLHDLEGRRKAKQEPMEGEALDEVVFNRKMVTKSGQFPSYPQLLTASAREKIEAIYKIDFEAYRDYL